MKKMYAMINNKKGFTLIELIVVIAILGLLAAVAVPRLSGFTDKAKIAADQQYGALVMNATMTMIAAGDLVITDEATSCVITFDSTADDGTIASISNITYTTKIANFAAYETELAKLVAPDAPDYYKTAYTATFNLAGTKTVTGTK